MNYGSGSDMGAAERNRIGFLRYHNRKRLACALKGGDD